MTHPGPQRARFPLWIKLPYTLFVAILIPVYWHDYGPQNFLWFSDIALFGLLIALWTENALLAGMMAVAVLVPETIWNISFIVRLIFGIDPFGLAGYMFQSDLPLYLRGLSLFHVPLPPLLVWAVYRLGYDRRAFAAQIALAWVVLPLTWLITAPEKNINWVHGLGTTPQQKLPPLVYLGVVMLTYPVVFYLPVHLILRKWLPSPTDSETEI